METKEVPLTGMIERLAEALDATGGVAKKGQNREQGYAFVKAADVAKEFRHELFKRGIVLLPHEESISEKQFETNSGKKATEVTIAIVFKLTDGVDSYELRAFGVGRDFSDKAIYKAKTGALKYFLRTLGLMPDELEDPETTGIEEGETPAQKEHLKKLGLDEDPTKTRVSHVRAKTFVETATRRNHSEKEIAAYLATLKHIQAEELTQAEWDAAIKWANTPAKELTGKLTESLEEIERANGKKFASPDGLFKQVCK